MTGGACLDWWPRCPELSPPHPRRQYGIWPPHVTVRAFINPSAPSPVSIPALHHVNPWAPRLCICSCSCCTRLCRHRCSILPKSVWPRPPLFGRQVRPGVTVRLTLTARAPINMRMPVSKSSRISVTILTPTTSTAVDRSKLYFQRFSFFTHGQSYPRVCRFGNVYRQCLFAGHCAI